MLSTNYLVSAFAVLGLAAGQSSTLCSQSTVTLASQGDASALASACSTVSGSVAVATSVSGSINIDGIQEIKGDLNAIGASNLTSLQGKDLTILGGTLTLTSLTFLSTLTLPSLSSCKGLQWSHLTALQQVSFDNGLKKVQDILITDTQIGTLSGLIFQQANTIDFNNNIYLHSIKLPVINITTSITIDSNAPDMALDFTNLLTAGNMTLRNISSLNVPALSSVPGTFGFYGDYLTNLTCPNITSAGNLAIVGNAQLANLSMPLLRTLSNAFQIANNSALMSITGFPSLQSAGSIDVTGNFSKAELPALKDDWGAFNMQSSGNIDCSPFQSLANSHQIRGAFTCVSNSNNVQSGVGSGSGTSSGSNPTSSPKGAASIAKADMYRVIGLFALVGGLLQFML